MLHILASSALLLPVAVTAFGLETRLADTMETAFAEPAIRFSVRKVGGIHFVKIGRLNVSFSLSKR